MLRELKKYRTIAVIIFFYVAFYISCSCDKNEQVIIKKEGGITTIINSDKPIYPDTKVVCEEDLVIGETSDDPNYTFYSIRSILVDSGLNIYVLDTGNYQVKVFDKNGIFKYSFGKKGRGPGEFMAPIWFSLGKDESVFILDTINRKVLNFSKKGEWLDEFGIKANRPNELFLDSENHIYFAIESRKKEDIAQSYLNINKFDVKGNLLVDFGNFDHTRYQMFAGKSGSFGVHSLYSARNIWIVDLSGNLYTGLNTSYSVSIYSNDGKLTKIIKKEWTPPKVTQEDRTKMLSLYTDIDESVKSQVKFPEYKPAFSSFFIDDKKQLWVLTTVDYKAERKFDVFDSDGRFIFNTTLPSSPIVFCKNYIYSIVRTDDDLPVVKRYRYYQKN